MDVLKDLLYGKLHRRDDANARYDEILQCITESEKELSELLGDKGEKIFGAYRDSVYALMRLQEEDAFAEGFLLGARVLIEVTKGGTT